MSILTFDQADDLIKIGNEWNDAQRQFASDGGAKLRDGLMRYLSRSVVFRQYIHHLGGPSPRNRFGWHAEGERLYAMSMLATAGMEGGVRLSDAGGTPLEDAMGLGLALNLMMAQVYLWSDEIETLADATPLPPHVISKDVLPYPLMFWSRETAHSGPGWETNWLIMMHSAHGIRTVADVQYGRDDARVMIGDIPYGKRYPDDIPEEHRPGVGAILGRLSFLASPYIERATERVPRAWRREATRMGLPDAAADPLIRVVKLRHEAQAAVDRQREDNAHPIERRSHWWVSGHHRSQWYPSKQAHEVIWIAPYLKGDLSKPLAEKVYKVVR